MATVLVSTVVNAPADEVWAYVRGFDALATWHPGMPPMPLLEGKAGDQVGAVRELPGSDGAVRETLLALDDDRRTSTYTIADGILPVRGYRGTLSVIPVTDPPSCVFQYRSTFDVDADQEEATVAMLTDLFRPGVLAVRDRFAAGG